MIYETPEQMPIEINKNEWIEVVFAADCIYDKSDTEHEYPMCPKCKKDYAECPCIGPTMDDEYEYKEIDGKVYARKLK